MTSSQPRQKRTRLPYVEGISEHGRTSNEPTWGGIRASTDRYITNDSV